MVWMWTWSGKCFGYLEGEDLWTYDGRHVGRLQGADIFSPRGNYLGEVMNDTWLITCLSKKNWQGYSFRPYGRRSGYAPYANYAGYAMYAGYEDFPHPNSL